MNRLCHFGLAGLVALPFVLACQQGGAPSDSAQLAASWTGSDTGEVKAAARAGWCAEEGRLEILAVRDDEGVGLAVYPDSELAGTYRAFDPGIDSATRPGVSAAARWYTDPAIIGYQSDSGALALTTSGGLVSGEFGFRLRSLDGEDTIRMSGGFQQLRPGACPADSLPNSPDPE